MPSLLIFPDTGKTQRHELGESTTTIGRGSENVIVLDEPSVSTYHAEISRSEEGWVLRDLQSSNGTKWNGKAFQNGTIRDQDVVHFGGVECRFEEGAAQQISKSSCSRVAATILLALGVFV